MGGTVELDSLGREGTGVAIAGGVDRELRADADGAADSRSSTPRIASVITAVRSPVAAQTPWPGRCRLVCTTSPSAEKLLRLRFFSGSAGKVTIQAPTSGWAICGMRSIQSLFSPITASGET